MEKVKPYLAWHDFSLAMLRFAQMIKKHEQTCGGELEVWEHEDAGYFNFKCKKCGLRGWVHPVIWRQRQQKHMTEIPTIELVWLYEEE